MMGCVTLVGAGPGDPGLLTIRGRAALLEAQVVVYDRLVSPAVLALIPDGAQRVDVGKEASHHTVPQKEINQILLDEALGGKNVVRLKGGDPFLFGRGGEELEGLRAAGIPFRVVPGISSALAAPAYGGIPVTHRDCASSLHIITAHARAGKEPRIDFCALVKLGGTLVFLMGVSALPFLCRGLLAAGLDGATPAAVVENGTTPAQRRVSATVATLETAAAQAQLHSPAVIVVGAVCALAEGFDWFSRLPLRGKTVVVTRPRGRAGTLSDRLRALGADVLEYPCIETAPLEPCPAAQAALDGLAEYEYLALTSPTGAERMFALLKGRGQDARALAPVKVAALGSGTAQALRAGGVRADLVPEVYDAAHLGALLGSLAAGRVLILRAQEGSVELTRALDAAGVGYDDIPVYRTLCQCPQAAALKTKIGAGAVLVTFTSASTVRGFVASLGEDWDASRVTGVCIGAQTAAEAQKYGIRTVTAPRATIEDLIKSIEEEV